MPQESSILCCGSSAQQSFDTIRQFLMMYREHLVKKGDQLESEKLQKPSRTRIALKEIETVPESNSRRKRGTKVWKREIPERRSRRFNYRGEFKEKRGIDDCPEIDVKSVLAQTILGRGTSATICRAKKRNE